MRNCVMVAQQTLTLFVWVQILVPQPADRPPFGVVFFCRLAAEQGLSPGKEHSLLFAERRKQTVHTAKGGILRREEQRALL